MIEITKVPVTAFEQNCRIIHRADSAAAVVVDPGGDIPTVLATLTRLGKHCEAIWLTHSHLDHVGGVAPLLKENEVPLLGHRLEADFRKSVAQVAAMYGISGFENCPEPSRYVEDGDTFEWFGSTWKVLFTPGHSPGHVCYYSEKDRVLLAGDTLFAGSIGRTDLPGGDLETLLESIRTKLFVLPKDVRVLSGHGPDTSIGHEQATNPFLRG